MKYKYASNRVLKKKKKCFDILVVIELLLILACLFMSK